MNKIAVIGLGNISKRHRKNLRELYPEAGIFAVSASGRKLQESQDNVDEYLLSIDELLKHKIDMAIVASPASLHMIQAAQLLQANIPVLIEKPLSDSLESVSAVENILRAHSDKIDIAYNLRFMPSAIALKTFLTNGSLGKIYSVSINVGQYLPDWRPAIDYRNSVSARKELGGGVLLELSHEIDYLLWFFGSFDTVYCIAENSGALDVNVEDTVDAILHRKEDGLVVNLHMDFLQRSPTRICKIIGEAGTLVWDALCNSITLYKTQNEKEVIFSDPEYDRNSMYIEELVHFTKVAKGELNPEVDIAQALRILKLIEAMKQSSATRQVVNVGEVL